MTPPAGRDAIVAADAAATVVLAVAAVAAVAFPDSLALAYASIGVLCFLAGCGAFVWSYVLAAGRSRTEVLSVAGIWFLSGSAPAGVRRRLLGALALQVVVVLVAASLQPFTAVAFGVLAPMLGLGLTGLWGARHGTFPEREPPRGRRSAS